MSILFALAAAVGFGSSDFAAGHASRRSSAVSVVILTHFASFIALLAVSVFPGQGGSPTVADIGWGLAAGLGGGFGAMFLFRGLGKGSMAVVAPITAAGAATIPVMAGLLQGESISIFGVFGVGLALVAIVMISLCADEADEADDAVDTETDIGSGTDIDAVASLASIASVAATAPWTAPVGPPVVASSPMESPSVPVPATAALRAVTQPVESAGRFAPVFAPPVVGPASVLAASTPFAALAPAAAPIETPVPVVAPLPAPVIAAAPVTVAAAALAAPVLAAPMAARLAAPELAAPTLAAPTLAAPTLAAPTLVAPTLVAPTLVAPAPQPLSAPAAGPGSFMPPPLMHHSILEAAPSAGVALLDLPPVPNDVSSLLEQSHPGGALPSPHGKLATALAPPSPSAPVSPPSPPTQLTGTTVSFTRTAAPTLAPPVSAAPVVPAPIAPAPIAPTPPAPPIAPTPPVAPAPLIAPPIAPVASAPPAPAATAGPLTAQAPVVTSTVPAVASTPTPTAGTSGVLAMLRSILRRPGIIDALLSGVGFGLFFVFIARTSATAGQWPLASARGISAAMFFVGALVARGAVLPERGSRRAVVLAGVLDAIAAVFFVLSTRAGLLSVGAVLASLYPAATIVLARFISHERIGKRQIFGLMLAGLAVSLLAI